MNNQELRRRIEAVKDTVKITRAMHVISASKMNTTQQRCSASLNYMRQLQRMIPLVCKEGVSHPYISGSVASGEKAIIVVASDKGLCGDYNHRILSVADEFIKNNQVKSIFAIGYEALAHYRSLGIEVDNAYVHIQEPHAFDATVIAEDMTTLFKDGLFSEVYIAYTRAPSPQKQNAFVKKLLPVEVPKNDKSYDTAVEPDSYDTVDSFLFQYIVSEIYHALADNQLSVNYKRMVSMNESTKNGEQLVQNLTMQYNHRRQESITGELINTSTTKRGDK